MRRQRGAALLGTLLAALALALGWVLAQQAQTTALLQRSAAQQRYWYAEAQADLWLARAQRLLWQASPHWQCRTLAPSWHACIRALDVQRALLCVSGQPSPLTYSLIRVRYLEGETHERAQRYRALPDGWIDFLPAGIACPAAGERAG
ncbi:DUF2509 family protein [Edwardsiella piscicida]|uniref:DUF2509 family protein n=1 Tax=Edwardsiella piscicida TaxID=1263550 RepID=UPI000933E35B|nr:DUF2509 family protein [Edwardsiella piscicida]EKS7793468.1 DUF2509 family protein [Edwardsiella piscicida]EKS7812484.1 DUF2509 family protein [Edwardsiella piscicida]ELM3721410.1 DUF2509 family protein [Edwardsiella piscicida]ELM3728203.1 DUF2509 family protein [Edwardsiella piscicida]ELV7537529.1 DUF2509 family protein [Edwardsiella piscicida]